MIPSSIFAIWFSGLLSLGIVGTSLYLLYEWYQRVKVHQPDGRTILQFHFGANEPTALLVGGLLLLLLALGGSLFVRLFLILTQPKSTNAPPSRVRDGQIQRLRRPDGAELCIVRHGVAFGPALIFSHGWGMDSTEWSNIRGRLGNRFQLVSWDLPGLGESSKPASKDYSVPRFADDLDAIIKQVGEQPAVLVGHSIGGMITMTWCRKLSKALSARVAGLVLVHTTYTNPLKTTQFAPLLQALERPVIVPLLHLTIWLSPVVKLMNRLSYMNGSAHMSMKWSSFARTVSWNTLDFSARYSLSMSPAVVSRGMLGMLEYDASDILKNIDIPTLIVAADRDPVCKRDASERIASEVLHSQLLVLTPARHLGFMEHNSDFERVIEGFVESCLAANKPKTPGNRVPPTEEAAARSDERRVLSSKVTVREM